MSHLTWVRGLKQQRWIYFKHLICVAPYVGAWVETELKNNKRCQCGVAPYVGAWVETVDIYDEADVRKSHLTWVRGLKLMKKYTRTLWEKSHLTWVRGLKLW